MLGNTGNDVFVVVPDEGESYEVSVDLRDIRAWERQGFRNTMRNLIENTKADDLFSLVYVAIKRQRLRTLPPTVDEWADTHTVQPKASNTVAALDRIELAAVIEKALMGVTVTPESIADAVMDLLESLPGRGADPTRTGR